MEKQERDHDRKNNFFDGWKKHSDSVSPVFVTTSYLYWSRTGIALAWSLDHHVLSDYMACRIVADQYSEFGLPVQIVLPLEKNEFDKNSCRKLLFLEDS